MIVEPASHPLHHPERERERGEGNIRMYVQHACNVKLFPAEYGVLPDYETAETLKERRCPTQDAREHRLQPEINSELIQLTSYLHRAIAAI